MGFFKSHVGYDYRHDGGKIGVRLMNIISMADLDLAGQRVLIRADLNVPLQDGMIADSSRIDRLLPTLRAALAANAKVMLMSHLGRPTEGEYEAKYSLLPVADYLRQALDCPVDFVCDYLGGIELAAGRLVLCENVRFNVGEKANHPELAKKMAALCDVFVMDAFATAHRAQASTVGIAKFAPLACVGPLMQQELTAILQAMQQPKQPIVAIVGGSKVSTKIQLLSSLLKRVDVLIVGGGIANTFLAAAGFDVGKSLYEVDYVSLAKNLIREAKEHAVQIPLPTDVCVATEFSKDAPATMKACGEVGADEMILDIGAKTIAAYADILQTAGTIIWNGPVGVFEFAAFAKGTQGIGEAIAASQAYSLAGGGDTLAALAMFKLTDNISYVSTGGGAFLALLEGHQLPAVEAIKNRENI